MALIVQIIIALIIAGFVLWAGRQLVAVLPLDDLIKRVIDIVLVILAVAVIIFYAIVPLLGLLANMHLPMLGR